MKNVLIQYMLGKNKNDYRIPVMQQKNTNRGFCVWKFLQRLLQNKSSVANKIKMFKINE